MGQFASLATYLPRLFPFRQNMKLVERRVQAVSVADLLRAVSNATTARQLTDAVNNMQEQLWKAPAIQTIERVHLADQLLAVLHTQVLFASSASVRTAAASFLRMFIQMGLSSQPDTVFTTLVTATVQVTDTMVHGEQERSIYLKLLFECFWPFRYPCPAFSWEQFPPNAIFYPLVPLLDTLPQREQEMLLSIFSELPTLNESEFTNFLLPFALRWSQHSDARCRYSICGILARMSNEQAYEALCRLKNDTDATVRARANNALHHRKQS